MLGEGNALKRRGMFGRGGERKDIEVEGKREIREGGKNALRGRECLEEKAA